MPCSTHSRAPSISGTASSSTRAATPDPPDPEALHISARCPSRPKPVTSVHALAPYERHTSDAFLFDCCMLWSAAMIHLPLVLFRIRAAKSTPVPRGLVNTSTSPARIPPLPRQPCAAAELLSPPLSSPPLSPPPSLSRADPRGATPLMANPRLISAPSQVWPPTSAQPSSLRASQAPLMSCSRASPTLASRPKGSTTMASAVTAGQPMAWQSLRA
mmetsp:Transcript_11284/g.26515  ORF Transcript_11284/g.26515 Transcript_11284/m.26515 type:complete len:216 (-) Transcript_11284:788-1435(-)